MIEYKSELQKILLLTEFDKLEAQLNSIFKFISEKDLAGFFIDSVYLKSVLQHVIDEHWIQTKNSGNELHFERFIKKFFNAELKPLLFLHAFFSDSSIEGMHVAVKALAHTEKTFLTFIKSKPYSFQKIFLQISLQRMSDLFEIEHQMSSIEKKNESDATLSLYRAFDVLDQIFGLDYLLDEKAGIDQKERLYEGAGVGVQSSYASILLALRYLNLAKGSHFTDLGSGYGRVGLVVGLMRPDIHFTGYEFVKDRVDIANTVATHLQLNKNVRFVSQDLANPDFKIPFAETFYIFDSFTDVTYALVMEQLQEMSQQKKIIVVTKGNSKLWMKNKFWSEPQEFSGGNLCFFRSRAAPKMQNN